MDQGSAPTPNVGMEPRAAPVVATEAVVSSVARRSLGFRLRDYAGSYLFALPYILFAAAFLYGPLVYAFYVSLHKWNLFTTDRSFVGLSNYYRTLFDTNTFWNTEFFDGMKHTLLFVVWSVPLLVGIALSLALLLASAPWRAFFRAVFYVPAVLSVTVACTVWVWIFQEQPGARGLANQIIHQDIPWLTTQPSAWAALIVTTLWWTIGFNMVILLAGIIEVPNDYHEAAKIDGASAWQRVWHITIPILRPILAFVSITTMLGSFSLFGQSYVMTGGGPAESTTSITQYIYREAFSNNNLAIASTMSFLFGLFLMIISILQIRVFRAGEA